MSYALITGASKGIGKSLAQSLALRKFDLLLVARSASLLQQLAGELSATCGVQAHTLSLDLTDPGAVNEVMRWVESGRYEVSVLVNNAGYGLWGNFRDRGPEEINQMLQLNMQTLVNLTYRMIPLLSRQPQSHILNVGSMAGYQAMPTFSLYAASKAFVNTFTRGLSWELRGSPIQVTLLAPGSVRTNFVQRSGMDHLERINHRTAMDPGPLAEEAIRAMLQGKREVMPGFVNRFYVFLIRLLPKSLIEKSVWSIYRKKDHPEPEPHG